MCASDLWQFFVYKNHLFVTGINSSPSFSSCSWSFSYTSFYDYATVMLFPPCPPVRFILRLETIVTKMHFDKQIVLTFFWLLLYRLKDLVSGIVVSGPTFTAKKEPRKPVLRKKTYWDILGLWIVSEVQFTRLISRIDEELNCVRPKQWTSSSKKELRYTNMASA